MNRKKLGTVGVIVAAAIILNIGAVFAAGGSQGQSEAGGGEWKWERKVTLVCPWGVGGGADGTLRPLQPLLQETLGVPVEIVNIEGAGGANGVTFVARQPADGYTYLMGTQAMIMMDLQKILTVDWRKDFKPVAKLVHSINILASSKKAMTGKYSNFSEFIAYAKNHPKDLNCATQTSTGTDSVALKQTLAEGLGVKTADVDNYIKNVNYPSGAEISSAMVGGHVFVAITGADEVRGLIQSGDIVPLISMSEKRMSSFPNIQSTGEIGLNSYVGTWRGLYARSSTPQAAIDSITKALEKVWNMPAYQDFLRQASYLDRPGFADGTEFQKLMNAEYVIFEDYLKTIGIIK